MRTPLQIVLIRDPRDRGTDVYADTLRLAFEGSAGTAGSPSAYLDDAVDLGIRVLEPTEGVTDKEVERLLEGAEHTVVVVIGEVRDPTALFEEKLARDNFVQVVGPSPPSTGDIQGEKAQDGVEPALAPVVTALRTMQSARRILTQGTGDNGDDDGKNSLKLFISHAKIDGVAMAKSLIAVLKQLREADQQNLEFEYFYDDEHLSPGVVWSQVLDAEARQSVLIALRTEGYESRYWCRREFLSAEWNGMPIIVVDLRKAQYHDSALLPFDLVPTVRVHDGNVIRVLLHAMAAHLRALRVRSQAPSGVRVLPHRPSVYSLDGASQVANVENTEKIAYPGPRWPDAFRRAVEPILTQDSWQMELVTFDDLEGC